MYGSAEGPGFFPENYQVAFQLKDYGSKTLDPKSSGSDRK